MGEELAKLFIYIRFLEARLQKNRNICKNIRKQIE
jgi:hypothetical protein